MPIFSSHYIEQDGCWRWQGVKGWTGYGHITRNGRHGMLAHRYAYEQAKGPIPAGYHVDHLCNVLDCVNPDHLEAVTPAENARRRPITKLTTDKVAEIKDRLASGQSQRSIAALYGVAQCTVSRINTGRYWRVESCR